MYTILSSHELYYIGYFSLQVVIPPRGAHILSTRIFRLLHVLRHSLRGAVVGGRIVWENVASTAVRAIARSLDIELGGCKQWA